MLIEGTIIQEILQAYLAPFLSLCVFYIFLVKCSLVNRRTTRLFKASFFIIVLLMIATSLDHYLSFLDGDAYLYRRIAACVNFILCPVPIILMIYVYTKFSKREQILMLIPVFLNAIFSIVSIFTSCVFFIDETNTYTRGTFFFIPFLAICIYLAILLIYSVIHRKQNIAFESYFILASVIIVLITGFVQVYLKIDFIIWTVGAFVTILYYLLIMIKNVYHDTLTGAYSRSVYQYTLNNLVARNKHFILVMLDMNKLKNFNDSFGHNVGDAALTSLIMELQNKRNSSESIYRIGGDEFAIISKNLDENALRAKLKEIHEHYILIMDKEVSFAYGLCVYDGSLPIEKVIKKADENMYSMKKDMEGKAFKNLN